jgi:hypothetical protein
LIIEWQQIVLKSKIFHSVMGTRHSFGRCYGKIVFVIGTVEQLLGGRAQVDLLMNRILANNLNGNFDMAKFTNEFKGLTVVADATSSRRQWTVL